MEYKKNGTLKAYEKIKEAQVAKAHLVRRSILPNLSPEEIEVLLNNFESLIQKEILSKYYKRNCQLCNHAERRKINKDLLDGITYKDICEHYQVALTHVTNHFNAHLMLILRPQAVDALVDLATKIQSEKPFPINSTKIRQLNWCQMQYMCARQIIWDNMDKPYMVNFGALDRYVGVVTKIRETIILAFGNKIDDKGLTAAELQEEDLSELITEDQQAVIKSARARRARKTRAEDIINVQRGNVGLPVIKQGYPKPFQGVPATLGSGAVESDMAPPAGENAPHAKRALPSGEPRSGEERDGRSDV